MNHAQWMIFSHEWRIVAVYNRDELVADNDGWVIEDEKGERVTRPKTDILYYCECGKVKTITIQGKWTLEQINGRS
jgi:hypothetical protein